MKKIIRLSVLVAFTFLITLTSFAAAWQSNEQGWWYLHDDGTYPVSTWEWIDGNNDGIAECYYFDVNKCKHCPFKDGCYKDEAKTKSFSVKVKTDTHIAQMDYMKTEEFKEYYSHRYKIEAKNAELKNVYNYDKSNACGQSGITIQGAITLYLANLKRIYKLEDEKAEKNTVK